MSYKRVDLNLFRVFDAIMTHQSVAGASRELEVTPSAVSHALARLRKLLNDELFTLSSDGMLPTQRAMQLAPNIRESLGNIARVLDSAPFDPASSNRIFGIAASDLTATAILPNVMAKILKIAPNISMRILPLGRMDVVQQLDDGRIDLVLGWFDALPGRMRRQTLMWEQETMVVRSKHPLTKEKITRQKLLAYPHIVVEFTGRDDQVTDGFLDDRGLFRRTWIERLLIETNGESKMLVGRVAVTTPNYGSIIPMLEVTDMIATLPRRLAIRAVKRDGLNMLELPYPPLSVAVEMVWHERAEANSGLRWLVGLIQLAGKEAEAGIIP